MPVINCLKRFSCIAMDVEEGLKIEDEYDFAEDAVDFESQLALAKNVEFTEIFAQPLKKGAFIVITGTPSEDIPWFAINLGCDANSAGTVDFPVHFNVRMPQCYVVRNTKKNNKWGVEETSSFRRFPFKYGRPFSIEMLYDDKETLWAVDGVHYCSYAHKQPAPATATWVQVVGVRDAALTVSVTDHYPTLAPELLEVSLTESIDSPPSEDEPKWPRNPVGKLSDGIPMGVQLVIHGSMRPLLHSFTIALTCQHGEWPAPDVAMQVAVRAHATAGLARQLVVMAARRAGGWGAERRQRTARLIPGTDATFRIFRNAEDWQVFVDNLLIGEYRATIPSKDVRCVRISGDFYPKRIYLCPVVHIPAPASPKSPKSHLSFIQSR